MGNWLVGESSAGPSGGSSDGLSGGWPDLPAVPAHQLKDFIHAKLKPSEECLNLIDQDVDAISDFLRSSELPVRKVAKVRAGFETEAAPHPHPIPRGDAEHCFTPGPGDCTSQGFSPSADMKADSSRGPSSSQVAFCLATPLAGCFISVYDSVCLGL